MSRRRIVAGILALVAIVIAASLLGPGAMTAASSALSVGPQGWFVARQYLEARGHAITLIDRPSSQTVAADVWVIAFPWQRADYRLELAGLHRHLISGGSLVFAYSGSALSQGENLLVEWLGLDGWSERGRPPLNPIRWYSFVTEEWALNSPAGSPGPAIVISALERIPKPPQGARVLFQGPGEAPVIYLFPLLKGRVFVLPAETFANARIANRGNANLIETLGAGLGDRWAFDEYHHGLTAPRAAAETFPRFAFDLLLWHLAAFYAVSVWRLGRRFGPPWRERRPVSGSTTSFLLGLGSLHHRLGHHEVAARALLQRARELQPRLFLPAAVRVTNAAELVALARTVAGAQGKRSAI